MTIARPTASALATAMRPPVISGLVLSIPCLLPFIDWVTPICFAILLISVPLQALTARRRLILANPILYLSIVYFLAYITDFYLYTVDEGTMGKLLSDVTLIKQALLWGYRGYVCLLTGYTVVWNMRSTKLRRAPADLKTIAAPFAMNRLLVIFGILHLLGFVLEVQVYGGIGLVFMGLPQEIHAPYSVEQIIFYFKFCSRFYVFFLSTMGLSGIPLSSVNKYLRWAVLLHLCIDIAGAGSKSVILEHLLSYMLPYLFQMRKFSIRMIALSLVMGVLMLFVFNVIANYRENVQDARFDLEQKTKTARVQLQIAVFTESMKESVGDLFIGKEARQSREETQRDIYSRLGFLRSFALLHVASGGNPPYDNALSTFFLPVTAFLPRSLVPKKAVFYSSGKLAHLLGWTFGGVSVTLIGSLYWTWGYAGILAGMAFLGGLIAHYAIIYFRRLSFRSWFMSSGMLLILILFMMDVGKSFQDIVTAAVRFYVLLSASFLCAMVKTRRARSISVNPGESVS
jgi:hypothetical protein